jgi:hypothetical protein
VVGQHTSAAASRHRGIEGQFGWTFRLDSGPADEALRPRLQPPLPAHRENSHRLRDDEGLSLHRASQLPGATMKALFRSPFND